MFSIYVSCEPFRYLLLFFTDIYYWLYFAKLSDDYNFGGVEANDTSNGSLIFICI